MLSLKQLLGGPVNWVRRSANYTAKNGDGIQLDSTGGSFNVTLPATPLDGHFVKFMDVGNYCAVNKVNVLRNGSLIRNLSENLEINISGTGFTLIYNSVKGWGFETLEYVIPQADAIIAVGVMSGGYVTRSGSNLLYAPDVSNKCMCYNGRWIPQDIPDAGVTIACTGLTPSTDYYLYFNTTLELSVTPPTLQNGIAVKGTKLCIARCRTDASGNILTYNEDASQQLVFNYYNRKLVTLTRQETTASWTYRGVWRAFNNSNANRIQFVTDGKTGTMVNFGAYVTLGSSNVAVIGVGIDSVTVNASTGYGTFGSSGYSLAINALYSGILSAGFHYVQALEGTYDNVATACTFYGPQAGGSGGVDYHTKNGLHVVTMA